MPLSYMLAEDTPTTTPRHVFIFFGMMIFVYVVGSYLRTLVPDFTVFMQVAFVLGGLVAFIFSFVNLSMAAIGLIFILPIVNVSMPGLNFYFTYGDAYLLVLSFAWILRLMVKREERLRGSFLDRPIFLFVMLSALSMVVSVNFFDSVKDLVQTIEFFVFTFLIYQTVLKTKEDLDTLMLELALSCCLISLYGIREYIAGGMGNYRAMSTFSHFNAFGAYLAFLIPTFFNLMISEKILWRKIIYWAAMGLSVIAIAVTFSRGAWMGVMGGLIFSGWRRGMVQFVKILILVTVVVVVASVILPERFISRAASITSVNDVSTQSRFKQYNMAEEIIFDSPFLGVGLGGLYFYATARGTPYIGEIHNLILYTAAERGIPAMLVLIWLFVVYYTTFIKKINRTKYRYFHTFYIANMGSITSYLIVNLSAYQMVRGVGMLFGIFLGAAVAASRIETELEEAGEMEEDVDEIPLRREPSLLAHLPRGA